MAMFPLTEKNLGVINSGTPQQIIFPYENVYLITSIVASCDCAEVINEPNMQRLIVNYTPKPIPVHLAAQGMYQTTKTLTVQYLDMQQREYTVILSFNATVK